MLKFGVIGDSHQVEIFGTKAGATLYPGAIYTYDAEVKANINITNLKVDIRYTHSNRFVILSTACSEKNNSASFWSRPCWCRKTLDAIYLSA